MSKLQDAVQAGRCAITITRVSVRGARVSCSSPLRYPALIRRPRTLLDRGEKGLDHRLSMTSSRSGVRRWVKLPCPIIALMDADADQQPESRRRNVLAKRLPIDGGVE